MHKHEQNGQSKTQFNFWHDSSFLQFLQLYNGRGFHPWKQWYMGLIQEITSPVVLYGTKGSLQKGWLAVFPSQGPSLCAWGRGSKTKPEHLLESLSLFHKSDQLCDNGSAFRDMVNVLCVAPYAVCQLQPSTLWVQRNTPLLVKSDSLFFWKPLVHQLA